MKAILNRILAVVMSAVMIFTITQLPGSDSVYAGTGESAAVKAAGASVSDSSEPEGYREDAERADEGDNPYGLERGYLFQSVVPNELALIRDDKVLLRKDYAEGKRKTNKDEGNTIAYDFDNCDTADYSISDNKLFGGKAVAVKNPYTNIDSIMAQVGYRNDGNVYVRTVNLD